MFSHVQDLQFEAKPDGPDPAFARRFQEVLGGKWGEMTVAMQYLYQGWNTRLPGKYKDMLLDIGTEELAHVEMIVTMIDRLLDAAPLSLDDAKTDTLKAQYAHSNPQHPIHNGNAASPMDSMGNPWNGLFVTASGNLYADFHLNATAEMQGRLQVARLWHMTDDPGVKELLKFLITRDHMHQMQWLRAIEELQADGLDGVPVPEAFDLENEIDEFAALYVHASDGDKATEGRWAQGQSFDGRHQVTVQETPEAYGSRPTLPPGDPRLYSTPPMDAKGMIQTIKEKLT
ncbi:manganese catalase family protein [Vallicoccus soli]|uniref:Manganese catalase family protein n=1 Tax=Vallicoccus soli TaxID=2339232 RepID=A0A3A3YNM6_9ACTN|nr:manganese catalase family protein [Vallicoccus soli]RJK92758.1 manganese catalase family protein [Vallicoccus soli]